MENPSNDLQVIFRKTMVRLLHQSMRGFRRFAKKSGLSITQMIALRQIYYHSKNSGCSVSDISGKLGITNPAASQLLDKLVQMDLVTRQENPHDRRSKQLYVTEKGENFLKESMLSQQAWIETLMNRLSPEETQLISRGLSLLAEKLAEVEQESHPSHH